MKLSNSIPLLGLCLALTIPTLYAEPALNTPLQETKVNLSEAYLSHWFSYDSAEPINLSLTALEDDVLGERAEIRFTSDDGQVVNGLIAYPKNKAKPTKLALAMHPMGIDQQFWWSEKSPLDAHQMTTHLLEQGYTVISLDARKHGERSREGFGPRELIARAHSAEPRLYIETIIGTVRDYRIALNWAKQEFSPDQVLLVGYSMGAQMSLLLASFEPSVNAVVAMVPPYVGSDTSPVAPRIHVNKISDAKVLWLAGTKDRHSDQNQTQETFDQIASSDKVLTWFESGHRLPIEYLDTALSFFDSLESDTRLEGEKQ